VSEEQEVSSVFGILRVVADLGQREGETAKAWAERLQQINQTGLSGEQRDRLQTALCGAHLGMEPKDLRERGPPLLRSRGNRGATPAPSSLDRAKEAFAALGAQDRETFFLWMTTCPAKVGAP